MWIYACFSFKNFDEQISSEIISEFDSTKNLIFYNPMLNLNENFDINNYEFLFFFNYDEKIYKFNTLKLFINLREDSPGVLKSSYFNLKLPFERPNYYILDGQKDKDFFSQWDKMALTQSTPLSTELLSIVSQQYYSSKIDLTKIIFERMILSDGIINLKTTDILEIILNDLKENITNFNSYIVNYINTYSKLFELKIFFTNDLQNYESVSTKSFSFEKLQKYKFLMINIKTGEKLFYLNILQNFLQTFAPRPSYNISTLGSKLENIKISITNSFLNCFWMNLNYSNKSPLSESVLKINFEYSLLESNLLMTDILSFSFTNTQLNFELKNKFLGIANSSTRNFITDSDWRFLCIHKNKNKFGNSEYIETNLLYEGEKSSMVNINKNICSNDFKIFYSNELGIMTEKLPTNIISLLIYSFNYVIENFNSQYVKISNFNIFSFQSSDIGLKDLFVNLRYSNRETLPGPTNIFFKNTYIDYSLQAQSKFGFVKNSYEYFSNLINDKNYFTSIISPGYPKILLEFGQTSNYDFYLKLDGEFMYKLLFLQTKSKLKATFYSTDPGTGIDIEPQLDSYKSSFFSFYSLSKTKYPNIRINIFISDEVSLNFYYNISREISSRSAPSYNNIYMDSDMYNFVKFYINYSSVDKGKLSRFFQKIYFFNFLTVQKINKIFSNLITDKLTEKSNIMNTTVLSDLKTYSSGFSTLSDGYINLEISSKYSFKFLCLFRYIMQMVLESDYSYSSNFLPLLTSMTYTTSSSSTTLTYYNYKYLKNLELFLNKNFLDLSGSGENKTILSIRLKNPGWRYKLKFNLKFLQFPSGIEVSFLSTIKYKLHEVDSDNYIYEIIYLETGKQYIIDTFADQSIVLYGDAVNILILHEELEFGLFNYLQKTPSTYNYSFYLKNFLLPLKLKSSSSTKVSLFSKEYNHNYEFDNIFSFSSTENLSDKEGKLKINDILNELLSPSPSSLSLNISKIPNYISVCNDHIIFIKTNLRLMDFIKKEIPSKLSYFEKEFTIYFNPLCKCSTKQIYADSSEFLFISYSDVVVFATKASIKNQMVINLNGCQNNQKQLVYYYEKATLESKNLFKYKMNSITLSDLYFYLPSDTVSLMEFNIKYEVTTQILLRNLSENGKLCEFDIYRYNDSNYKYIKNVVSADCFKLILMRSDDLVKEPAIVIKVTSNFSLSKELLRQTVNLNFGQAPLFTLSISPSSGNINQIFSMSIIMQSRTLINDFNCYYYFCLKGTLSTCLLKSQIVKLIDPSNKPQLLSDSYNFRFSLKSDVLNNTSNNFNTMNLSCKLCDKINLCTEKLDKNVIVNYTPIPIIPPRNSSLSPDPPQNSTIIPEPPINSTTIPEPPINSTIIPEPPQNSTIIPEPLINSSIIPEPPINSTTMPEAPKNSTIIPEPPKNSTPSSLPTSRTDFIQKPQILIDPTKNNSDIISNFSKSDNKTKELIISDLTKTFKEKNNSNDILQKSILINEIIHIDNCENVDSCIKNKTSIQSEIVEKLASVLNCENVFETVFNSSNPSNEIILSVLSIYYATSNFNTFTNSSIFQVTDIIKCLISTSPNLLENYKSQYSPNISLLIQTTEDLINTLSSVSSNIIEVAKQNNENINNTSTLGNVTIAKNMSLVVTENNLQIKDCIEDNSILWMKLTENNKKLIINVNSSNSVSDKSYMETSNLIFFSDKLESLNEYKKGRILISSTRNLNEADIDQHILDIEKHNSSIKIFLPKESLKIYSSQIETFGAILYNKYPLLSSNNDNVSEKVISLKMFNSNFSNIEVKNLIEPIRLLIKKPDPSYRHCVFFSQQNKTWDNQQCTYVDLNEYVMCVCNHLTDFTLAKYNPVDIVKGVIKLFNDVRIMDGFELFRRLTWKNATVVYIYGSMFLLYLLGLIFTIWYDCKSNDDFFLKTVDREEKCCFDEEQIIQEVIEVREMTDKKIAQKREDRINFFLAYVKKKRSSEEFQNIVSFFKKKIEVKKPNNTTSFSFILNHQNSTEIELKTVNDTNISDNHKINTQLSISPLTLKLEKKKIILDDQNEIHMIDIVEKLYKHSDKFKNSIIKTFSSNKKTIIPDDVTEQSASENNQNNDDPDEKTIVTTIKENSKVNKWFIRYYSILFYYFKTEYRPLALALPIQSNILKTNLWSLTLFRISTALSVCALLSESNSKSGCDERCYANRDLSVSVATILIIEVPFTIFEYYLTKFKITKTVSSTRRYY